MRLKHSLRYCFLLLALAATGLYADAAVTSVEPAKAGHHRTHKFARRAHKRHHHHHRGNHHRNRV